LEGIDRERHLLSALRGQADVVLDTSNLAPRELRRRLEETLLSEELSGQLFVSLVSFGYKFGLPDEADLVLDARFLPNPFWVPSLRLLTGQDAAVKEYVVDRPDAKEFLDRVADLLRFLAPRFLSEQKRRLVLALGCTGGRHRSVALAEALRSLLAGEALMVTSVSHRDLEKSG
jgi:UPF0042 nucleotide-binding protein